MGSPSSSGFGGAIGAMQGGPSALTDWLKAHGANPAAMDNPAIQKKLSKMGGAQSPSNYGLPSLAGVPTASSLVGGQPNSEMTPDARAQLLQTMIDRSRNPQATGTMTTPPAGNPNVVIK